MSGQPPEESQAGNTKNGNPLWTNQRTEGPSTSLAAASRWRSGRRHCRPVHTPLPGLGELPSGANSTLSRGPAPSSGDRLDRRGWRAAHPRSPRLGRGIWCQQCARTTCPTARRAVVAHRETPRGSSASSEPSGVLADPRGRLRGLVPGVSPGSRSSGASPASRSGAVSGGLGPRRAPAVVVGGRCPSPVPESRRLWAPGHPGAPACRPRREPSRLMLQSRLLLDGRQKRAYRLHRLVTRLTPDRRDDAPHLQTRDEAGHPRRGRVDRHVLPGREEHE